jgi:ankyrin repeat protein
MNAKTLALTAALGLIAGCEKSGDAPATSPVAAAPARVAAKVDPAKVAQLSQQLAARILFGNAEELANLLQQGATADAKNRYGLPVIFLAAQRGDAAILELLIKAGANVNSQIAVSYNNDGVGYSGTADGTPLTYAAGAGKVASLAVLHKAGADLNGQGPGGTTPLMRAAENNQLEAVQWLIEQGSFAGKDKALALCQRVVNPAEKTKEIMRLLKMGL